MELLSHLLLSFKKMYLCFEEAMPLKNLEILLLLLKKTNYFVLLLTNHKQFSTGMPYAIISIVNLHFQKQLWRNPHGVN